MDGGWPSGAAPLGYGASGLGTTVGFGPNPNGKWITTYFRRTFSVSHVAELLALRLRLEKDDAAIVYLNNSEVLRSNFKEGDFTFLTFALEDVTGADETHVQTAYIPASLLRDGDNVVTVEVHQFSPNTPDCRFDLELAGLRIFDVISVGTSATLDMLVSGAAGLLHLQVTGTARASYRVEESSDLETWTILTTGTCSAEGFLVVDLGLPAADSRRCFRAIAE